MSNNINWHVTQEEAEATIHKGVNSLYIHNMNYEPNMSKDEARQQTAQAAEKGLAYLEEFQQNQPSQLEQEESIVETGNTIEDNGTIDASAVSSNLVTGESNGPEVGDSDGLDIGDGGIE